jgi:hypothetical protein
MDHGDSRCTPDKDRVANFRDDSYFFYVVG